MDEENNHIQNGYQLFMTYRLGYQFHFFKNCIFIEPSVAITHWPVNTNVPESFAILENKWPNYFLFEPGLHFGVNFCNIFTRTEDYFLIGEPPKLKNNGDMEPLIIFSDR